MAVGPAAGAPGEPAVHAALPPGARPADPGLQPSARAARWRSAGRALDGPPAQLRWAVAWPLPGGVLVLVAHGGRARLWEAPGAARPRLDADAGGVLLTAAAGAAVWRARLG